MEKDKSTEFIGDETQGFLIVGIGASAGGIQALKGFFEHVPPDSGMAYVVILHLLPDHDSKLAEILQTVAAIPVLQVTRNTKIEPDHIFVVPPNQHLAIQDGHIAPFVNTHIEDRRAPVDIFFRHLADTHGPRAVCVVLSGTGANGSMGLKRIKEKGGIAYVQSPREAVFNEMPRNSIATDLVDEVLPVAEIPARIIAYRNSLGSVQIVEEAEKGPEPKQEALHEIFARLRVGTGHDFTNYKRLTLLRRIERRINVRNLPDLPSYAAFLRENPEEVHALLKDLLISVTNFFRDGKAFDALEGEVMSQIFSRKTSEDQIRIWVAGCATGEEAYSIAMLCAERTLDAVNAPKVQIFATDIDEAAIATAREGLYTLNDAADVSPDRLRRFFNRDGERYRIRSEIREMILFVNHNFIKDPPFSRLNLVSCRNVLIYLNSTAQARAIETFHFAIQPRGFLFLGSAESVDGSSHLFAAYHRESHIFQAREVFSCNYPVPESVPNFQFLKNDPLQKPEEPESRTSPISFGELHQKLLEQYAPPSVVVNEEYDILHMTEEAGRYLEFSGGELTQNLLKLIRPEIRLELRSALYQAVQHKMPVEALRVRLLVDGKARLLDIHVRPVFETGDPAKGFILIVFKQAEEAAPQEDRPVLMAAQEPVARQLEEELIRLKAQLRNSAEQHEYQAEELKASNEELQAMNEELRSAAEELETSKEELQSINEELRTLNQELKIKIEETTLSSNNLQNLVNSTEIATIFLDRRFRVVLFTPSARQIFNLIATDYGRPLADITSQLEYKDVLNDAQTVLQTLQPVEKELQAISKQTYLMRILPYRTSEDHINGSVISFINITARKIADEALRVSEERFRAFVTTSSDVVYRMNADWSEMFSLKGMEFLEDTKDPSRTWLQRYIPEKEQPRVHAAISESIRTKTMFQLEHRVYRADGSISWTFSKAIPRVNEYGEIIEWFGAASDVTVRVEAERKVREAEEKYRLQLEQKVEERTAELKQREENLKASNELLQSIYDTTLYGMSVMEAVRNEDGQIEDFRIVLVNKELQRETGRTDLVGRLYAAEYPDVKAAGLYELIVRTIETGEPGSIEYHYPYEGFSKWFSCQYVKLGDGVVATNIDITERKKAEAEIF